MARASSQEERAFATSLWENFDTVVKRATDGRTDVKVMSSFLRERAKTEEAYAKSVQSSSRQNPFLAKCSAAPCWQEMINAEESMYKQHSQFGTACSGFADKLDSYAIENKNQRVQAEKAYSRISKDRNAKSTSNKKAQETYTQRVATAESAITDLNTGKLNAGNPKQILKLDQGAARAVQSCGLAHESYKNTVTDLEQSQRAFDTEITKLLDAFQESEKKRIDLVQEIATKYNQFQGFIENALKQLSLLSTKYDKIDSAQDITDFTKESASKNERPGYVEYIYIESVLMEKYKPGQFGTMPTTPNTARTHRSTSSTFSTKAPAAPAASVAATDLKSSSASTFSTSLTSSADSAPAAPATIVPPAIIEYATALYTFDLDDKENLIFEAGAYIKLTKCLKEEDWWEGELDGKTGMFPQSYVKHMKHGSVCGDDINTVESQYKSLNATCTATFDFAGQDTDELSFALGETLTIEKDMDGWYLGRNAKGEVGIFPSNYVAMDDITDAARESETAGAEAF